MVVAAVMADSELLTDDELDLTEEERRRRAQPEAIGSPIEPSHFSTDEPLATPAQPKSEAIGAPLQLQTPFAQRPAYERYQTLASEQPKPWHDLGIGGRIGRVAESIGTAINPNVVSAIPGTAQHHQVEVGRARTAAEQENREIASKGEEELRGAQTEEQKALAKKNATPVAKHVPTVIAGPNGEPLAAGYDPATNQYINPDTQQPIPGAKKWEKPATPPHGNDFDSFYTKWLHDNKQPDTAANQLAAHKQWETQGGKDAAGTWMPLYDDKGHVTGAWNPANGQVKKTSELPGRTAPGEHIATSADAAMEKKVAPLRGVIEEADKAAALKDAADKGNAEADVDLALTFFKTMRSATGGGSGIRFTQQENNLIMGARNIQGSIEVHGNKVFSNGEPLSRDQRQQIFEVIQIHKAAAQRQLDELKQGGGGTAATPNTAAPASGGFKPF